VLCADDGSHNIDRSACNASAPGNAPTYLHYAYCRNMLAGSTHAITLVSQWRSESLLETSSGTCGNDTVNSAGVRLAAAVAKGNPPEACDKHAHTIDSLGRRLINVIAPKIRIRAASGFNPR
jgi:hypothetical protein